MRIQVTLTVAEGKRLIAKGIAARPDVKRALDGGKILLKGGTTVSAVSEELCGRPLRISGRITPRGTMSSKGIDETWHCAILEKGNLANIDGQVTQGVSALRKGDVVIIGANAFDHHGNAAIMFGRALGGGPGPGLSGMMSEVRSVIVAVGVEKMVPGNLNETIRDTARSEVDAAMGMAVGLVPVCGEICTELEALKTLANVQPRVIGRGGIRGAEGSATWIIDGEKREVLRIFKLLESLKRCGESGLEESLEECRPGGKCRFHLACVYRKKRKETGTE